MNKKFISGILVLLVLAIIVVIIIDFSNKRPAKLGGNPYKYDVEQYKSVDPSMVHYRETRNIPLGDEVPGGFDVYKGLIWIAGEGFLQAVTPDGVQKLKVEIEGEATCIETGDEGVFVGFEDHVSRFNLQGERVKKWDTPGRKCVFTSLALSGDKLFVADAGNRRILKYNLDGDLLGEFEGKAESDAGHGFIVPSPHFDIVVNSLGELWVVNPGKHALEEYSEDGRLLNSWQNSSIKIEGFTGCCNPAEIAVMRDGSFVTSEKGMVRIKVYDSSGHLKSVVAPPDKFNEEGEAPEVKVDDEGVIYALDFDRNTIRIFEKIAVRKNTG